MATYSTNLNLTKPDYDETADINVLNADFDLIDDIIAPDSANILRTYNLVNGALTTTATEAGWVVVEAVAGADNAKVVLSCGALKQSDVAFNSGDTLYVCLPIKIGQIITVTNQANVGTGTVKIYSFFEAEDET